ncbi:MAG: anti-sigma factor [Rhodoplanes sp.]|uniref:anti-sigma factor family protein n=1 Tax=Rhodoplanes sp. TaxID=1968906 RepID=UPI0017A2D998|nr:anti-sigma factor [Rhodoplanes sp.]NVO15576.1 anti-sigma factor [Rhodoplanes sp.]
MTCEDADLLLHALVDGELDAGHAREVERHLASCPRCAAALAELRALRSALQDVPLRREAPAALRSRIEAALPQPRSRPAPTDRRTLLKGFAFGSVFSGAIAATALVLLVRSDRGQRMHGDLVSAHLRSLQGTRLTDVETSDRHTVKPWFNGRLDLAPPVVDLTAKGFTLLGGRLDYLDGKPVAAIVYKRRRHVVNLFVEPSSAADTSPGVSTLQGFNIRHWSDGGLAFWAVSDIAADELAEFASVFDAARRTPEAA